MYYINKLITIFLIFSVKLFLNTLDANALNEAIQKSKLDLSFIMIYEYDNNLIIVTFFIALNEIGADRIDSLILSLSDKIFTHEDLPKEIMLPIWSAVQKCIQDKLVISAGLSDFNAKYLEQLCNSLDDKQVD